MVSDIYDMNSIEWKANRLNPCFNGIWSLIKIKDPLTDKVIGLNPCFNGIWSLIENLSPNWETSPWS